jgi:hypothetical protein
LVWKITRGASSFKLWEIFWFFLPSWHKAFVMINCKQNNLKYHWREKCPFTFPLKLLWNSWWRHHIKHVVTPILLWKRTWIRIFFKEVDNHALFAKLKLYLLHIIEYWTCNIKYDKHLKILHTSFHLQMQHQVVCPIWFCFTCNCKVGRHQNTQWITWPIFCWQVLCMEEH